MFHDLLYMCWNLKTHLVDGLNKNKLNRNWTRRRSRRSSAVSPSKSEGEVWGGYLQKVYIWQRGGNDIREGQTRDTHTPDRESRPFFLRLRCANADDAHARNFAPWPVGTDALTRTWAGHRQPSRRPAAGRDQRGRQSAAWSAALGPFLRATAWPRWASRSADRGNVSATPAIKRLFWLRASFLRY